MWNDLQKILAALPASSPEYATEFVERLLEGASRLGASDVHLQPIPDGLEVRVRSDGVLHSLGVFPPGEQSHVVARLKALSHLLTYRTDRPQEGRIPGGEGRPEVRVATFPTLNGERATIRLYSESGLRTVDELGISAGCS